MTESATSAESTAVRSQLDALWAAVVGQGDTVETLQNMVVDPVHAYLIVGPEGSGKRAVARALAAELLSQGLDERAALRAIRLVAEDAHPSLHTVERTGASISVGEAREIVRQAGMMPPEGQRQVFVLVDFHLVAQAAPTLLKSIEEPSERTVFIILAEEIPPELVTIASRCSQIGLSPISEAVLVETLVSEGADRAVAEAAAASSAGSLTRARLLVEDPQVAARDEAWYGVPEQLDGTGATACVLADELLELTEVVLTPLADAQAEEVRALEASYEALEESVPKGRMKELTDRHKREQRRLREDTLRSGLAAMLRRYRDEVGRGADPTAFLDASAAVQELTEGMAFNPNEGLQLRALLMRLPRL